MAGRWEGRVRFGTEVHGVDISGDCVGTGQLQYWEPGLTLATAQWACGQYYITPGSTMSDANNSLGNMIGPGRGKRA